MQNNIEAGALSTASRARLLNTILAGNLDIDAVPAGEQPNNTVWDHVIADNADPNHPENESLLRELTAPNHGAPNHGVPNHGAPNHEVPNHGAPNHGAPHADRTKTRLRTMLASQYSFGVAVGAPVVFFCASFIYNLLDNYSNPGDNDTSHALGKSTLISSGVHRSLILHSVWNVVDDDTSYCDN